MKRFFPLILFALLTGGCIQQIALSSLGGIMDTGFDVMNREEDLPLAGQSIGGNLKLLETIIERDPGNTHYLLLASRGYASYALGFIEDDAPDRARLFYLRAKEYGLRILERHAGFADSLSRGPDALRAALNALPDDDLPAVFWTAVGWASAINLSLTDPAALADLGTVEAMMRCSQERDSTYFYGSANAFLGVLYGSRPRILGGDPDRAKRFFDASHRLSGGKFLLPFVLEAKSYAVQIQDRDLFDRCLTLVDTTALDILPEARLSNAIAKQKAKLLRAKADDLF